MAHIFDAFKDLKILADRRAAAKKFKGSPFAKLLALKDDDGNLILTSSEIEAKAKREALYNNGK